MNRIIEVVRLLSPAPGRVEFALRLALVCTLTTAVTALYQTPSPALTAYVAFFLNRPDRAGSIATTIAMTILISVVLGLLVLVADAVVDVSAWRVASMEEIHRFLAERGLSIPHDSLTITHDGTRFELQCLIFAHAITRSGAMSRIAVEMAEMADVASFSVTHSSRA